MSWRHLPTGKQQKRIARSGENQVRLYYRGNSQVKQALLYDRQVGELAVAFGTIKAGIDYQL